MRNGKDTVPLDYTDLNEGACVIGADEHRHRVVLHEVADMEPYGVEHRSI